MTQAPTLILCPSAENPKQFRLGIFKGIAIEHIVNINAEILGDAIKVVKQILGSITELDLSAWNGDFSMGHLRVLNPEADAPRWMIDFSPKVPEEVNAVSITPVPPPNGF